MLQRNKQIVARILILIFSFYYANIGFFYHTHIIKGAAIVHSHFHSKAHAQTGTHGTGELRLISILLVFQSLQAASCIAGSGIFFVLLVIILPSRKKRTSRNLIINRPSRAPPSLFTSVC
jgi:hypothetical protein